MSSSRTVVRGCVSFPIVGDRYSVFEVGLGRTPQGGSVPGPLTFRMMERVGSSMNSTRTCVTPPREPVPTAVSISAFPSKNSIMTLASIPPCAVRNHHLHPPIAGGTIFVPVRPRTRVTLTSLTGTLADSILGGCDGLLTFEKTRRIGCKGLR